MSEEKNPRRKVSTALWLLSLAILTAGLVVWGWAQLSGINSLTVLINSPPYVVRILDIEFVAVGLGILLGLLSAIISGGKPLRKL